jgi:hypothetical protein
VIVDAAAAEPHFLVHLAPVWKALDPSERGTLYLRHDERTFKLATALGLDYTVAFGIPSTSTAVRLVAAWGDFKRVRRHGQPIVFMEHGAGLSFDSVHESYAGGRGREAASLLLCPNEQSAKKNSDAYPNIPTEIIGCPKLDDISPRSPVGRTVCISFHWPALVRPESSWALPEYRNWLGGLATEADCEVIGHGHPRAWARLDTLYRRFGIEPVESFDKALERCDVLINDSSSIIYEAAAAGRGVVVLNSKHYRRDVDFGLRFWDHIPGPQVNHGAMLAGTVKMMLDGGWRKWETARQEAVLAAYGSWGMDGGAAKRAVEAIRRHLG